MIFVFLKENTKDQSFSGVAWIIIPLRIKWEYDGFLYNSWRLYYAIIGLPTVVVALVLMTYPESPKFLLYRGKSEEALEILRDIYASNVGRYRSEYPVTKFLFMLPHSSIETWKFMKN